ncbi:MAG: hypothetical protein Q8R04_04105 [Nanoarchaeota archaeon]|nr:hypothetical protein [Nanoarchaeota archaeon]
MGKYFSDEKIVFSVTVGELQRESILKIGRKLTNEEIYKAAKGIEAGLSFDIETVFKTAIEESVK